MNIDERLNEMEPKDTPLLVLGYVILGMFLLIPLSAQAQDNEVTLDQTGDNFDLTVLQAGYDNKIDFSIGGTNNGVSLGSILFNFLSMFIILFITLVL